MCNVFLYIGLGYCKATHGVSHRTPTPSFVQEQNEAA